MPKMFLFTLEQGTFKKIIDGVKTTEFTSLLDTCTKTLGNAKIYVSLMTRRRDIPDQEISTANQLIKSACENFPNVKVIEQFNASDNMFYDEVHLNNNIGLPAIVKHLKVALHLSQPYQPRHNARRNNFHQHQSSNVTTGSYCRPLSAPPQQTVQESVNNLT